MKPDFYLAMALAFAGMLLPACTLAQSNDDMSLGDFARSLRKGRQPEGLIVIDNDNLFRVMDQVEGLRLNGGPLFSLEGSGKNFQMSSPDGTCSLSFSANATALLAPPYVAEELPQGELLKLDGPASITGDNLQISVFNGTAWSLREITVGLTIVRPANNAIHHGGAQVVPAVAQDVVAQDIDSAEKPSDVTLLLHLKGGIAPLATTVFREKLTAALGPGQEWHWAIVQAKGIPPSPLSTSTLGN